MAYLQDWVEMFLSKHKLRYKPHDWPMEDSEEWGEFVKLWVGAFASHRISEDEADLASMRLATKPPRWQREHIPAVVNEVLASRPVAFGPVPGEREEAQRQSKDCKYCGGNGLTTAYHPLYRGVSIVDVTDQYGEVIRRVVKAACHCVCQHGRWIRSKVDDESRKRTIDGDMIRVRRSDWSFDDPTVEAFIEEYGQISSVNQLRAFTRFRIERGDEKGPVPIGDILGDKAF